ncbi:hypothetical protein BKA80DRAFT_46159 [Phyllosticta citrichinensis]
MKKKVSGRRSRARFIVELGVHSAVARPWVEYGNSDCVRGYEQRVWRFWMVEALSVGWNEVVALKESTLIFILAWCWYCSCVSIVAPPWYCPRRPKRPTNHPSFTRQKPRRQTKYRIPLSSKLLSKFSLRVVCSIQPLAKCQRALNSPHIVVDQRANSYHTAPFQAHSDGDDI